MKEERRVVELNLDDILPNRFQPRIRFDEEAISELSESIKEHGVIQPIVVRPIADKYEIIAGERRYKASVMAGKKSIPAIIADLDDKESAEIALIENVQRQDLTPIEEAVSYKKILDMGYLTQNQLADKLGKDQSTVANKLRLLNLDDEVQEALLNEKISERHARSLLRLKHKDQRDLLHRIIEKRLTVRKTDEEISKLLGNASFTQVENLNMDNSSSNSSLKDEFEIIDVEEEQKSIPKEVSMNESNKQFNIPVSPIINDTPQSDFTTPAVMPAPSFEQPEATVNPTTPSFEGSFQSDNVALNSFDSFNQPVDIPTGKFFNVIEPEQVAEQASPTPADSFAINGGFDAQPIISPEVQSGSFEAPVIPVQPEPVVNQAPIIPNQPIYSFDDSIESPTPMVDQSAALLESLNEMPEIPLSDTESPIVPNSTVNPAPITTPDYNFEQEINPVLAVTPEVPQAVSNSKNLSTAIQAIRDCASQLSNAGFEVDLDEFDFENMYQVIFKIEKK